MDSRRITGSQLDTLDHDDEPAGAAGERHPAITVLWHVDPRRVGARAIFPDLGARAVEVTRLSPELSQPGEQAAAPLGDPFISRKPFVMRAAGRGGVELDRGLHGSELLADGFPVANVMRFGAEDLARGVVLELAQRVVLLLHARRAGSVDMAPAHGLTGASEAIERVRTAIGQVADLPVPVLLRGESGTGKELVARAIHAASRRSDRPLVALNLAAVPAGTAASELFGHVRGAFTGATQDHEGCFARAERGTLFLDEIGDIPADVQAMLLRTLESGEIQPVGARDTRRVDVRVVAATDADLESAAREGRFRDSLLHRLCSYQLRLPPLRARRDDIGRLLVGFLRAELAALGMEDRLSLSDPVGRPWLPVSFVARLARHRWPGNVRQLRNVARQLAIASRGEDRAIVDDSVELLLADAAVPAPAAPAAGRPSGTPRRKPSAISSEELLAALHACEWKIAPTAERLGITRSSLYNLMDRSPNVRRATDLTAAELRTAIDQHGRDVDGLARKLEVSPRGLRLRLKTLGLL